MLDSSGFGYLEGSSSMNSRDQAPSLYDTSVSSASGGRSSSTSRRSPMMQQQQQQQQRVHQYPGSSASSRYQSSRESSGKKRPVVAYPSSSPSPSNSSRQYASSSPRFRRTMATLSDPGSPIYGTTTHMDSRLSFSNDNAQSDVGASTSTRSTFAPSRSYSSSSHNAQQHQHNNNNNSVTNHSHSFATTTSSQDTRLASGGRPSPYARTQRHSATKRQDLPPPSQAAQTSLGERLYQQKLELSKSSSFGSYNRQPQQTHGLPKKNNSPDRELQRLDEQVDHVIARTQRAMQEDCFESGHHINHNNSNSSHQKHDDSDINSSFRIESPSPVNVKELKRQLWNDQEVLQVPSTPRVNDDNHYASDSEYYQHRQRQEDKQQPVSPVRRSFQETRTVKGDRASDPPMSPQHRLLSSRYARSVSPGKRRYHSQQQRQEPKPSASRHNTTSHMHAYSPATTGSAVLSSKQPDTLPYAASTVSDASSSAGKFHSKFYEAALAARMGGKVTRNRSFDEQSSGMRYSRQPSSPQYAPRHDEDSIRPPEIHRVDQSLYGSDHSQPAVKRNSFQKKSIASRHGDREPTQRYEATMNIRRSSSFSSSQYGGEQGLSRGRSTDPPPPRLSSRGKLPSPLIQDRIRSLSQDPSSRHETIGYDSGKHNHAQNAITNSQYADPRNESLEATIGMPSSDHVSKNNQFGLSNPASESPKHMQQQFHAGVSSKARSDQVAAYWQERTNSTPPTPSHAAQGVPGDSPRKQHGASHPGEHQEHTAPPSPSGNKVKMAQLMAKLNSVNRNNPEAALAEIDKILRQESHITAPFASSQKESEANDDDSDVSSITNPTYQGSSKPHLDRIRVVSPQGGAASYRNHSQTMEDDLPAKLSFNPSTSSFRRPRPSHLQNYAIMSPASQDPTAPAEFNAINGTDFERVQPKDSDSSPPADNLNDSNAFSNSFTENPFDEYASVQDRLLKPREVKAAVAPSRRIDALEQECLDSKPSRKPSPIAQTASQLRDSPKAPLVSSVAVKSEGRGKKGKLDNFISNKEALADQIRVWDSLSNGLSKSEPTFSKRDSQVEVPSKQELSLPRPPNQGFRRHPWDGKLPSRLENVKMRDTSMDEAIGIETEMSIRGEQYGKAAADHRNQFDSHVGNESIDRLMLENDHFAAGRTSIKNRAEDYLAIDPVYHIDEKVDEEKKVADAEAADIKFPDIPLDAVDLKDDANRIPSDINLMRNVTKSPGGALQFSPTSQPYAEPPSGTRSTEKDTKEDESSWVSMPSTTFFSQFNKTLNPFGESDSVIKPVSPKTKAQAQPSCREASRSSVEAPERENRASTEEMGPSPVSGTASDLSEQYRKTKRPPKASGSTMNRNAGAPVKTRRDGPPNAGLVDIDEFDDFGNSPMNQSVEQAEIEVSLMDMEANNRKLQNDAGGVAASRSGARSLACQTVGNREGRDRSRDKKKGFLRTFIERKKKKAAGSATVGHAASAASVTAHSMSLESRGARSVPVSAPATPATPEIRLMAPPPGVMDRRALTPNRGRRGQRSSKSSMRRARSNSLERFRSPSMAKKFNRVMKLYDDET